MVPSIDLKQAQRIVEKHYPTTAIANLTHLENYSYSHVPDTTTYLLDLASSQSCFLTISLPALPNPNPSLYHPNSLQTSTNLLTLILSNTDIPIHPSTLDASLSLIPYHYLISPIVPIPSCHLISLSHARASGILSEQAQVTIDLYLGQFLGQLHTHVQNDWFGIPHPTPPTDSSSSTYPNTPPDESGYSWQETFTSLLEDLLVRIEANEQAYGVHLPYPDIRHYLSRAIGSFLFDDVEVPSLTWFTGSEEDIFIVHPSPGSTALIAHNPEPGSIVAILPNFRHALWGDPLLESFMINDQSHAFLEGYKAGGGEPLLVFARQRTKRLWYTVFLALVVLTKHQPAGEEEDWAKEKDWARKTLEECVVKLKDAPCY